jgi:hypothetical protein
MRREIEELLEDSEVGPLRWVPPKGISGRLDGGRRGYPAEEGGFFLKRWGGSSRGVAPKLHERSLALSEALLVATALDSIGVLGSGRYPTAVAWVQAIIVAIPEAYDAAVEAVESQAAGLREARAEARGFSVVFAADVECPF